MPEPAQPGSSPAPKKQFITLSIADFEALQTRRFEYRLLFGFLIACWMGVTLFSKNLSGQPYNILISVMVVAIGLAVIRLYRVMTALGYARWVAIGLCVIQVVPIPGFFILLLADRQIARAIDSAAPPDNPTGTS